MGSVEIGSHKSSAVTCTDQKETMERNVDTPTTFALMIQ